MKIILVRPNYNYGHITPPLGIGYLCSYLKLHGIECSIIDGYKDKLSNSRILELLRIENPDAVGITCLTSYYYQVVELAKQIKNCEFRCIIGGVHPTFLPFETLQDSGADFIICGEGEIPLLQLVKNNFINKNIKGVYSRDSLESIKIPIVQADTIKNLDEIPFPDWQQMPPNLYPPDPHGGVFKNYPIGIITTSRGCPYKCTYCASPVFYQHKIRFRSAKNVVDEIKYLIENFHVKEIQFEDDNLTLKRSHIEEICYLIISDDIKISWSVPNGIRADKIDESLVKLMKKAGCHYFAIGVESGSPEVLLKTKKNESLEEIANAIKISEKNGIQTQGFFILGLPGETKKTIEKTIQFAMKSGLSRAYFAILNILPGSELWHGLKGSYDKNWSNHNAIEAEWIPEGLSKKEIKKAQINALLRFYLRPKQFIRFLKTIHFTQVKFYLIYILRTYFPTNKDKKNV